MNVISEALDGFCLACYGVKLEGLTNDQQRLAVQDAFYGGVLVSLKSMVTDGVPYTMLYDELEEFRLGTQKRYRDAGLLIPAGYRQ